MTYQNTHNGFVQLKNAIKKTFFKENFEKDLKHHPFMKPERYAPTENNVEAALMLHEDVLAINETDYGDFMRKAMSAVLHFQESLLDPSQDIKEMIVQIKAYLQFSPSWHVDSTKEKTLSDIEILISVLVSENKNYGLVSKGASNEYNL